MGNSGDSEQTRGLLIDAAGELFAERGFNGVTARQIVAKAGVSLGAIPYHFGSMENLYRETLFEACKASPNAGSLAEQAERAEPHEALRLAVLWTLQEYSASEVSWHVKLIEREFLDPSESFREVVRLKLQPDWDWLCSILGKAVGQPANSEPVLFGVVTMFTLAATLVTYGPLIQQLAPSFSKRTTDLQGLSRILAALTIEAVEQHRSQFVSLPTKSRRQSSKRKRP
ncbi:MAG: TetR/AcrR family transcriptional regulator [Planctomycetota bacterium]|jgi:AcrR family transcriptional regulator